MYKWKEKKRKGNGQETDEHAHVRRRRDAKLGTRNATYIFKQVAIISELNSNNLFTTGFWSTRNININLTFLF